MRSFILSWLQLSTSGAELNYLRSRCDYSLETLRRELPALIASVSLTVIRRFYAHVRCYSSAYAQGKFKLSLAEIEWAMRKYTSHRRAKDPPADLDTQSLMPEWFCNMPAKGGACDGSKPTGGESV